MVRLNTLTLIEVYLYANSPDTTKQSSRVNRFYTVESNNRYIRLSTTFGQVLRFYSIFSKHPLDQVCPFFYTFNDELLQTDSRGSLIFKIIVVLVVQ